MNHHLFRLTGSIAAMLGVAIISLCSATPSAGRDDKPAKTDSDPVIPREGQEVTTGVANCEQCHNYESDVDRKKNRFVKNFHSHKYVRLNEGVTWLRDDPHSHSFAVLNTPLGKQMSSILKYDVTKKAQCLTCHAIDTKPTLPPEKKVFYTKEGITCNACHGLLSPWQTLHFKETLVGDDQKLLWRTFTPQDKAAAGLRNLRDPVVRAQLCTSCHVGNPAEDKVVTHEMYAAGHPPLPPFELATFMECQPRHWGYPIDPELTYFTEAEFKQFAPPEVVKKHPNWTWDLYRFYPKAQEVYLARSVVAGAIASLRSEMLMLSNEASAAAQPNSHIGVDYARFDCYACHHDLQIPSARQARGYEGKPGRPPLKAWIAALPSVVAEHATTLDGLADAGKEFPTKWAAVRTAALSQPFGDANELAKAAKDMGQWCDEFLKRSSGSSKPLYSQEKARDLLNAIGAAATSTKWTADPEAAMHLTWAYVSLKEAIDDKAISPALLSPLKTKIPIRVRFPPFSTKDNEPKPAGVEIAPRLDLFRQYQPKDFIEKFQLLHGSQKP